MGWLGVAGVAVAKGPKGGEATDGGGGGMLMPDLGKVLGPEWEVPPELSDRAQPGHVIEVTLGGYKRVLQGCVAAKASESPVTSVSMQNSLSGGVGWSGGLVKASAEASHALTLNFQGPFVLSFDEIDFVPSAECVAKLREVASRGGMDPSRWVLVQEALMARVSGCQETMASAGVSVPGGGAAVQAGGSCQMYSDAPVAVGVKTRPVMRFSELGGLGGAPAPAPAPVPVPVPVAAVPRPAPAPVAAPSPAAVSGGGDSWTGTSGYAMRLVPSGRYVVGSPAGEAERFDDEAQHSVVLTHSVWMGATEVTQGQYRTVMGENPSKFSACGDSCPVETVSWLDAVRYANALSAREGLESCYEVSGERVKWPRGVLCSGYRLPTESEWEVAARGGGSGVYAGGNELGSLGWYRENSGWRTHAVGGKSANGYGLYDMSGNVWEWTWDVYGEYPSGEVTDPLGARDGALRVYRGGGWSYDRRSARVASRRGNEAGCRNFLLGFRLARTNP